MNVLIAGLGLLGGSIGLALKDHPDYTVWALGRNTERLNKALEAGIVSRIATEPEALVPEADIIVLCTPVGTIPRMAESLVHLLKPDACVTDIGSTKGWICQNMVRILGDNKGAFLGAHPMAGSEKTGFEHAKPDLFAGHPIVLTKTGFETDHTLTTIEQFWSTLSTNIYWMDPDSHDTTVAITSHLPHAAAFTMAYYLSSREEARDNFFGIYGKGLLDTLRIAASDAVMWEDIMKTNRVNIADALEEYKDLIGVLENWIRTGKHHEIAALIQKAGTMCRQLSENHTAGE